MIRTEAEYQYALGQRQQEEQFIAKQRQWLVDSGFSPIEVERAMQPILSFHSQLVEEIEAFERILSKK